MGKVAAEANRLSGLASSILECVKKAAHFFFELGVYSPTPPGIFPSGGLRGCREFERRLVGSTGSAYQFPKKSTLEYY
jgi:hypothetical protein